MDSNSPFELAYRPAAQPVLVKVFVGLYVVAVITLVLMVGLISIAKTPASIVFIAFMPFLWLYGLVQPLVAAALLIISAVLAKRATGSSRLTYLSGLLLSLLLLLPWIIPGFGEMIGMF